jgi:hypothetical protein
MRFRDEFIPKLMEKVVAWLEKETDQIFADESRCAPPFFRFETTISAGSSPTDRCKERS